MPLVTSIKLFQDKIELLNELNLLLLWRAVFYRQRHLQNFFPWLLTGGHVSKMYLVVVCSSVHNTTSNPCILTALNASKIRRSITQSDNPPTRWHRKATRWAVWLSACLQYSKTAGINTNALVKPSEQAIFFLLQSRQMKQIMSKFL